LNRSNKIWWTGFTLVALIVLISLSAPLQQYASLPRELRMFSGQEKFLNLHIPVNAKVRIDHPEVVKVNGQSRPSFHLHLHDPIQLSSAAVGAAQVELKLFGAIPLKTVKVDVIPDLKVIPGGQTIGVKLKSDGALVVGHHQVLTANGEKISPGEQAQIKRGDWITHMNGKRLTSIHQVAEMVESAGKKGEPVKLTILRGQKKFQVQVKPVLDQKDQVYRMGLYIRDSAAGVGTLTFYAPDQGVYGALGHLITDMDTQTPMTVASGEIVHSSVTSISKSRNGSPGEKRAQFFNNGKVLGNIEKNSEYGIFGKMTEYPGNSISNEAMPVALAHEVKEGPAQIYTVIEGQKVEKFDIEIVHVARQDKPSTKGMVIKIVDPRLLERTGGIVQGMSGSPIIQDGKIVGAVTHVFVNDPASGYGCFIEWMLQESGVLLRPQEKMNAS
jgi:stage IV sporulation protein B